MKKIKKAILLILACCLCSGLLTGCGVSTETIVNTINSIYRKVGKLIFKGDQYSFNEGNYIDARIEAIISAADNDDADALYALFGPNIVNHNENLHEEADEFVDAIDGEFISNRKLYGEESSSSRDHDGIKTQILIVEEVETTEGKYVIDFIDNPEVYDDDLKGMQSLGIQTYEDYKEDPCFAPDYSGIYVVTPDNHDGIEALKIGS